MKTNYVLATTNIFLCGGGFALCMYGAFQRPNPEFYLANAVIPIVLGAVSVSYRQKYLIKIRMNEIEREDLESKLPDENIND